MIDLPADAAHLALAFMLVLARIGAAMAVMPAFSETAAPVMLRIGVALAMTILLLPGLAPQLPAVPEASLAAAGLVGIEVVTGLWFGWLARIVTLSLPTAAQFIAYLLGLTSVLQPDPDLGPQTTALATLANLAVPVVLLVSGLYAYPLAALGELYRVVPFGALLPAADGTHMAVTAVSAAFLLAVRLASPFIVAAIVWHVTIGLITRLVPRMQIYFVTMPGQIAGGLLLLAGLATTILAAWQDAVRAAFLGLPGSG